jgi:FkbM family methyltransferase
MTKRPAVFVLAATNHGPMILSHLDDFKITVEHEGKDVTNEYGVGYELLRDSEYGMFEAQLFKDAITYRRASRGDGVVAIDCGANIGVFTVELAKYMTGWGNVIAFEAQERIFYALAGNIALNNVFNATAMNVAVGEKVGLLEIPTLDYTIPSSFGSLEIKPLPAREIIGQDVNYDDHLTKVASFTIDSLNLERVDLIKLDIEGMELDALKGCDSTIHRHHPIIYAEYHKVGEQPIKDFIEDYGYKTYHNNRSLICLHESDDINLTIVEQKP